MKTSEQNRSNKRIEKGRFDWFILERIQTDVTKTGNGERGAGSGERGTEVWERVAAETSTKSKMAVQKNEREKEEYKERNSIVPWLKSDGDEIANQTHILRLRFEQVVCFFDIQPVSFTI